MKMKLITTALVCIVLLTQAGCKKEPHIIPVPTPNPAKQSILDVKWRKFFYSDSTGGGYHNPYFFDNYIVFCTQLLTGNSSAQLGIGVYHKQTGTKHPAWNHEPGGIVAKNSSIDDWLVGGINNNYAIFSESYRVRCFELTTGYQKWSVPLSNGMPRISSFGNKVFSSVLYKTHATLIQTEISSGVSKPIITLYNTNNYEPSIEPPAEWVSPWGDSIIIFQNRQWNFPASDGKIDIYAYNMTADSILWKYDDLTTNGNSSVKKPIIVGNKLLFQGSKSIHCINLLSGKMIWQEEFSDEGFALADNLYAEGKVFLCSETGSVLCYDVATGTQIWYNKNAAAYPASGGSMGYYKGKLYLTGCPKGYGELMCISGVDGNVLWIDVGPPNGGGIHNGIIIDHATGYLYCNDWETIMCIDLNNTPKPKK